MVAVTIHNRLSRVMGEKRLTIARLARATGLHHTTVSDWYYGRTDRIDLRTLNTLCEYLGVTPGDLLEYEPGPQGDPA